MRAIKSVSWIEIKCNWKFYSKIVGIVYFIFDEKLNTLVVGILHLIFYGEVNTPLKCQLGATFAFAGNGSRNHRYL